MRRLLTLTAAAMLNTACLLPPAVKGPDKPSATECCQEFARGGDGVECHGTVLVGETAEAIGKAVNQTIYNNNALIGIGDRSGNPELYHCKVGSIGQLNDKQQAPVSVR